MHCDDILEKDISDDNVNMLAPADHIELNTLNVNFWWQFVEGANKYQLQIVSPGFKAISQMVLDTVLLKNKWNGKLLEGNYQWRVKAINDYYATSYTTMTFSIDTIAINDDLIKEN